MFSYRKLSARTRTIILVTLLGILTILIVTEPRGDVFNFIKGFLNGILIVMFLGEVMLYFMNKKK
ncbi:hypothetical protein JAO76_02580 [Pontibacter sp. BT310]|jgi:hypothetical protein|uniref:Uncharacterized protein n=1 Tax=Pontibacter populi TaxID=890055 RepID=A0ABS6X7C9_9BACT|nr:MULTISPECIES: hypothetical protein [Pontibacter]MBJ6117060.1 hypothetical protein [Pontibacter sp. BT310]MBR0569484.1 hypothetical protein [Microvirga sp. STS03]MBW3363913.1 hypothetical protein [Pontibacter populi]